MGHELLIADHNNEKGPTEWRFNESFEDIDLAPLNIGLLIGHGLIHQVKYKYNPPSISVDDDEDIITEFTTGFDWVNPEESRGGTELMRNWILGAGGVPLYLQREIQIVSRIEKIPGYVSEFPYGLD